MKMTRTEEIIELGNSIGEDAAHYDNEDYPADLAYAIEELGAMTASELEIFRCAYEDGLANVNRATARCWRMNLELSRAA